MTAQLTESAIRLTDILARENAALHAMDLPAATALVAEKSTALAALSVAAEPGASSLPHTLATRLRDLAAENQRLLETALTVQGRVLGVIARAAAQQAQRAAPRYGMGGGIAASRPAAIAISARESAVFHVKQSTGHVASLVRPRSGRRDML
jgi:hypothetical protein